jgi:hypothetical protein|tara:strand:+ start:149 stop:427 length:279 start_codon:yes stop_codon:yes gene_type:complete
MAIAKRIRNKTTGRNYKKEYASYQGKPKVIAKRVSRDTARRAMQKRGLVKKGSGMDVDHKDGNPMNNNKKNLRAVSKFKNRSFARNKNGGKK